MKHMILAIFLIVLFLIFLLLIFYSLIAGIWGYNPFDIVWFNTKLLITSIIGIIITGILTNISSD